MKRYRTEGVDIWLVDLEGNRRYWCGRLSPALARWVVNLLNKQLDEGDEPCR